MIVDESGNIKNTYHYDAWGSIVSQTETVENSHKYAGEYFDAETGLIYLRARYYDPSNRRFISEDKHWNTNNRIYGDREYEEYEIKIPNVASILQSNNLYVYCMDNPVIFLDMSGNAAEWLIMALYGYAQAVVTSPDLQYDMEMIALDISQKDYISAAFGLVDVLMPGFSGSKMIPKFIRKYFDDVITWVQHSKFNNIIDNSTFIRKTKGGTKLYNKSGGYKKALKDFKTLKLKNIETHKNGTVTGVMQDGTKVNLHQSHTDNMKWTLEVGNEKIRYEE